MNYRTGSDGAGVAEPELELESPTIGYRSELQGEQNDKMLLVCISESAAYDQLHYGECGEFGKSFMIDVNIFGMKFVVSRRTRDRKKILPQMEELEEGKEKERVKEIRTNQGGEQGEQSRRKRKERKISKGQRMKTSPLRELV